MSDKKLRSQKRARLMKDLRRWNGKYRLACQNGDDAKEMRAKTKLKMLKRSISGTLRKQFLNATKSIAL